MEQRLEAMVAREKDGKTFWTKIGVAFANAQGGWRITLDALPLNGQIHLFPPRPPRRQEEVSQDPSDNGEPVATRGDAPF
jgi:hypothetical protein